MLGTADVHARRTGASWTEQCCQSAQAANPRLRTGAGSCMQAGTGRGTIAAVISERGMQSWLLTHLLLQHATELLLLGHPLCCALR